MVGGAVSQGGVASNPAFHSSTNPEVHAICQSDGTDCRGYPSIIKASGFYPTNGIDPLTSSRIRLSILASEANLESGNTPTWASMRISVGTTTVRPTTQLITNAEENIDCKDETGANMVGGCKCCDFLSMYSSFNVFSVKISFKRTQTMSLTFL